MSQWYCYIAQQQYGPVGFEVLVAWAKEGRLRPEDLVWQEGMAAWVRADSVAGLFPPPIPAPPRPMPGGGTGGQTPNPDLMAQARGLLAGKWWAPIAVCLIVVAINAATGGGFPFYHAGNYGHGAHSSGGVHPFGLIGLIIAGPLALGKAMFFLAFTRRGTPPVTMVFDGFRDFVRALGAYLLRALFVFLWSLLLIIPGIIAALAYSQTFYLLTDDPTLGPLEAIARSKEMMRGHKGKLFCLYVRFFGWAIVCVLTLGIGFVWLWPYASTTFARFYEDLRPAQPASVATLPPMPIPGR